jgi:hypothetical protein
MAHNVVFVKCDALLDDSSALDNINGHDQMKMTIRAIIWPKKPAYG